MLEKLPPEARKLIEDSLAKASEGKKPEDEDKKPEKSPFSGPNSAELKMLDKIAHLMKIQRFYHPIRAATGSTWDRRLLSGRKSASS